MNKPARRRSSYKKTFEDDGQEQQDQSKARSSATDTLNPGAANMDGANRKVELQSPEDLTYLITNVRRAAAEHIGAAFPPVEGDDAAAEEDELRVRIEELVNDVSCTIPPPSFPCCLLYSRLWFIPERKQRHRHI